MSVKVYVPYNYRFETPFVPLPMKRLSLLRMCAEHKLYCDVDSYITNTDGNPKIGVTFDDPRDAMMFKLIME